MLHIRLVNDRHKVSVKADVYHFAESGIPHASVLFDAAGGVCGIGSVNLAFADRFYPLEIFHKMPFDVSNVVHCLFSFFIEVFFPLSDCIISPGS